MSKHILVAIDDSDTSRAALNEALAIARTQQGRLTVIHVADETLMGMRNRTLSTTLNVEQAIESIVQAGQALLDGAKAQADGVAVDTVLLEARGERVSEVIVNEAARQKADLLVLGSHGRRGIAKLLLGSVAEQVIRAADCSVLLVRSRG